MLILYKQPITATLPYQCCLINLNERGFADWKEKENKGIFVKIQQGRRQDCMVTSLLLQCKTELLSRTWRDERGKKENLSSAPACALICSPLKLVGVFLLPSLSFGSDLQCKTERVSEVNVVTLNIRPHPRDTER